MAGFMTDSLFCKCLSEIFNIPINLSSPQNTRRWNPQCVLNSFRTRFIYLLLNKMGSILKKMFFKVLVKLQWINWPLVTFVDQFVRVICKLPRSAGYRSSGQPCPETATNFVKILDSASNLTPESFQLWPLTISNKLLPHWKHFCFYFYCVRTRF